jgi:hypothetical protein
MFSPWASTGRQRVKSPQDKRRHRIIVVIGLMGVLRCIQCIKISDFMEHILKYKKPQKNTAPLGGVAAFVAIIFNVSRNGILGPGSNVEHPGQLMPLRGQAMYSISAFRQKLIILLAFRP